MQGFKRALTAVVLSTALVGAAQATPTEGDTLHRETAMGAGTGAVVGGIAAGPAGVLVGGWLGSIIGDQVADQRQTHTEQAVALNRAQQEINRLRGELLAAGDRLERLRHENRRLAQADQRLQSLDGKVALDVLFRTGSGELEPLAQQRLQELAALLQAFPGLDIELDGHADRRGGNTRNLELSQARAETVKQALVAAGVPAARIHTHAHGASQARASIKDADGLALDRRVSVQLTPAEEHYPATASTR